MSRVAYGVDLLDGTLKAVRLVRKGRRLVITRVWRIPCAGGVDPDRASLDALGEFLAQARPGSGAQIVVSAPTRGALSRTLVVPAVELDRVDDLVRYELLSELNTLEEERIIRHTVRRGVVEHRAYVYALVRRRVDRLRAHLAERRVPYDDLEHPGFALASYVETEQPRAHDRIVLGVGRTATELVLLTEDGLWTRHLPLGLDDEPDADALAARLRAEIHAAVAFFLKDQPFNPAEIVLTEEGALDRAFVTALHRRTELPVARLQQPQRLVLHRRLGHEPDVLALGKAIGLALAGAGVGRFRCPVLDGNPHRDAMRRLPLVAACALLAAAILVGMTLWIEHLAAAIDRALPVDLQGEMQDIVHQRELRDAERAEVGRSAQTLLALARRREATLHPRRALAAITDLSASLPAGGVHADQLFVSTGEVGRAGVMSVTLRASPEVPADLVPHLEGAFADRALEHVAVRGPERLAESGELRWVVEVTLP